MPCDGYSSIPYKSPVSGSSGVSQLERIPHDLDENDGFGDG